jgi:hypothetical protein
MEFPVAMIVLLREYQLAQDGRYSRGRGGDPEKISHRNVPVPFLKSSFWLAFTVHMQLNGNEY